MFDNFSIMTKVELYIKNEIGPDGTVREKVRVSVINRFGIVVKDMSYDEFKLMKGHDQVSLNVKKDFLVTG